MGLAISGQVLVLGLQDSGEDVEVAACFSRSEAAMPGRIIKKGKKGKKEMPPPDLPNGDDDEMNGDGGETEEAKRNGDLAKVACMAVSSDGQWLAVSDLGGKVSTYNMDTLRVGRIFLSKRRS
jgi:hypothetical protein